jgi:hypothetical protein
VPLDGKFPTQLWSPGDYISDSFVIPVPLMTTVGCAYQIYGGFFLGDSRLKLAAGSAGEDNRVPLGIITVR